MGYITPRSDRRRYLTWQKECWNKEFVCFLEAENKNVCWEKEWTPSGEFEQAILVQMIFGELLKNNQVIDCFRVGYNSLIAKKGEKNIYVYFDVMNNNDEIKNLDCLRHSVGNYAIYPKMYGHPSLQNIHKYFGERWDEFLRFLRANWEEKTVVYKTKQAEEYKYEQLESFGQKWCNVTFEKYMKITCQYMYYQIVFEDLIQNREKCATEKVVKELVDKYEKWDLSKEELITIKSVEDMKFLIEVREKMIMTKLAE